MSDAAGQHRETVSPLEEFPGPPTPSEREMLARFDAARRLSMLRVILPGLFAVTVLAFPFAIQADLAANTHNSVLQDGIGLVAFAAGSWAAWRRHANVASFMLFAGVTGVLVVLTLQDGPLRGSLDLTSVPELALFILPIVIAGLFGRGWAVALTTAGSVAYTLALLLLTPHAPMLAAALDETNGLVIFTVPISAQVALGVLMFAAARAIQRTLRELGDVRIAYERERELDRLKDQFISNVNHELRTPIMALQGYIEIAREQADGMVPSQARTLERAREAAEHLAGIVRSTLDLRRAESQADELQQRTFPLRPVVVAAANLLDPRDAGEIERALNLDVPADLEVYADEDRVRQVLVNLLSNAAKYSPPGSPIDITARVVGAPAGQRRAASASQPMVEVAVRDLGLGVPPEQAPLLFQRFARLERDIASPIAGTGLGLAICRAYVEAMGGRIWLESEGMVGAGTTVSFTLPLASVPAT